MIRVSLLYPSQPEAKFDDAYYFEKHLPIARQILAEAGAIRMEVDSGLAGGAPGSPAPYLRAAHIYFKSMDEAQKGLATMASRLISDVRNYTNVRLVVQISEIVIGE